MLFGRGLFGRGLFWKGWSARLGATAAWRVHPRLLLALAYPALVHAGVLLDRPVLRIVALFALVLGLLPARRIDALPSSLIGVALCGAVGLAFARPASTWHAVVGALAYVVPVVLHGALCLAFANSLRGGNEPLVTAIARRARGGLSAAMTRYTRRVTWLWAGIFAFMTLLSVVLPTISPLWWSWSTNVLNYLLFAAVVAVEYGLRRLWFRDESHPGFADYLRILVAADVRGR